jgi:hypothetical protein
MSPHVLTTAASRPSHEGRWAARAERHRVARYDQLGARLAELHHLRSLLAGASAVVEAGWVQPGWFPYRDPRGIDHLVGPHDLHRLTGGPVTGACLVGAVVLAGGGLAVAGSQPVHRALDLTWHALFRAGDAPVSFCPAPASRVARVRDLTWWNDQPHRRARDVTSLLRTADRAASAELQRLRPALPSVPIDSLS